MDMAEAYTAAVTALRTDTYPNHGFWSVPVLYAHDNVIPFPGSFGDPQGAYQRIFRQVTLLHEDLSSLRPDESWSADTWREMTMTFRVTADRRRAQIAELIDLVQPESRSGSKWAADVTSAAHRGITALDQAVSVAKSPRGDGGSVNDFTGSKTELTSTLAELRTCLSARLRFTY